MFNQDEEEAEAPRRRKLVPLDYGDAPPPTRQPAQAGKNQRKFIFVFFSIYYDSLIVLHKLDVISRVALKLAPGSGFLILSS